MKSTFHLLKTPTGRGFAIGINSDGTRTISAHFHVRELNAIIHALRFTSLNYSDGLGGSNADAQMELANLFAQARDHDRLVPAIDPKWHRDVKKSAESLSEFVNAKKTPVSFLTQTEWEHMPSAERCRLFLNLEIGGKDAETDKRGNAHRTPTAHWPFPVASGVRNGTDESTACGNDSGLSARYPFLANARVEPAGPHCANAEAGAGTCARHCGSADCD